MANTLKKKKAIKISRKVRSIRLLIKWREVEVDEEEELSARPPVTRLVCRGTNKHALIILRPKSKQLFSVHISTVHVKYQISSVFDHISVKFS